MSSPIQLDPQIHPRVDDRVKFMNQLNGMPLESQKRRERSPKADVIQTALSPRGSLKPNHPMLYVA
jgi:hypothetical protein